MDSQLKIWDVRTYKPLFEYYTLQPAAALDLSQRDLLAVAHGPHVTVWKDALQAKQRSPYLAHLYAGSAATDVRFCPFEDVLGVGHGQGIGSVLVPGAGEPNFDALEVNPFETRQQRRETEVRSLLDKIAPELITLDPSVIARPVPSRDKGAGAAGDDATATAAAAGGTPAPHPDAETSATDKAKRRAKRRAKRTTNIVEAAHGRQRERTRERVDAQQQQQRAARAAAIAARPRTALSRFERR